MLSSRGRFEFFQQGADAIGIPGQIYKFGSHKGPDEATSIHPFSVRPSGHSSSHTHALARL